MSYRRRANHRSDHYRPHPLPRTAAALTCPYLCREIDALRAERASAGDGGVTFRHVRGHDGDPLNERADVLATGAIKRA
jgi:ribonuclease HI